MGSHIQPSRFLDSAILSLFAMIISASFLYMFSEFYLLAFESKLFDNKVSMVLNRLFPFKTFEYNLTHILLFTLCIILLSLKPDYSFCKLSSRESRRYQGKEESSRMDDADRSQRDKKK
ncbi:antigen UB05, putative [Plasmodium chabaudi chabaudi]|uniref:Antigen UB05, putative n=2 Tax=Plasmodium chabaudi TaxID=5825 RepID=A0A077XBL7_PLACU|nr:antigen UB05, putative [Plasmodium chabaudi chabaudi]SCM00914.1 antigen UB05, putative [Plasmodium chabaudi chabaudi]SCM03393.1 antigen UB05, putative [Plasmodium chabaudi adami]SCM08201.1 antigen UB05, putative [Plasmodium chabaudi adami]VTZ67547.1 antigen UB05, putative [Plasmodium chabaudi chabaudi]|eukprot:XP_016655237.1 antigen UB05, putative [Plasmodium chabaudi chabaudi]